MVEPRAACAEAPDPEIFFPAFLGRRGVNSKTQVQRHLAVVNDAYCGHCPIRTECFIEGTKPGNWGVWGGYYFAQKGGKLPAGTSDLFEQLQGGSETAAG